MSRQRNQDLNVALIREDFPILKRVLRGNRKLVYLDNAPTTQKPLSVIDAISNYYKNHNSNIHRGVHQLQKKQRFNMNRLEKKLENL